MSKEKIWNSETGSLFEPHGGVWEPKPPEKPNAGRYEDQGSAEPLNVKHAKTITIDRTKTKK